MDIIQVRVIIILFIFCNSSLYYKLLFLVYLCVYLDT